MESYLGVFGHTALDIIIRVPRIPKLDSSIGIDERIVRFGGTAANISRTAAEMGVEVSLCSFVGDDFPEDYLHSLKRSGVHTHDLKKVDGLRTPRCWIVTDRDGNEFTLVDQGAMKEARNFKVAKKTLERCEVVHIGTGVPGYYKKIYHEISEEDKLIAFDPSQELEYVYDPDTFCSFLEQSHLFFCNEVEKEIALKYTEEKSVESMVESFDLDLVVVTQGEQGSTLFLTDERIDIPAYTPAKVKEATGAGDAFRGGFYAALYKGYSFEECCKIGSSRASFAVECAGSQKNLVGWDEGISRMEKDIIY